MDKQLKKIATAARREMERFVRKHDRLNADDLTCYCAISSYFLIMLGRKFGYKLIFVEGTAFVGNMKQLAKDLKSGEMQLSEVDSNHCWVEYEDAIIDLTATQFNRQVKKVHIVNTNDTEYFSMNKNNQAKANLRSGWPDEQSPYSYLPELRRRAKKVEEKLMA